MNNNTKLIAGVAIATSTVAVIIVHQANKIQNLKANLRTTKYAEKYWEDIARNMNKELTPEQADRALANIKTDWGFAEIVSKYFPKK